MKKREQETAGAPVSSGSRRSFLKKAGTIVVAAPVMESLSKEGLLVRSAHAQSGIVGLEGGFSGPVGDPS